MGKLPRAVAQGLQTGRATAHDTGESWGARQLLNKNINPNQSTGADQGRRHVNEFKAVRNLAKGL